MKYIYLNLLITTFLLGEKIPSVVSFQGFKGAINTPNALVYQEGEFEFLYSNQVDDFTPSSSIDFREHKKQDNYFLNMGILPNLDMNLRFSNANDTLRNIHYLSDRIISSKYQIPFIPNDLFQIAIGMQDMGGRAPHLKSTYAVISKDFDSLRTSLGYAKGKNLGSLNGTFASLEYQPLSWLNIAGEYDTHDWNAAIKTNYLATLGQQKINLGLMAKSSLGYKNLYLGLYANIPIFDQSKYLAINIHKIPSSLSSLKNHGFSNISYFIKEDTIYFEYENTLYTYSDIEALGVVLGTLAMSKKASKIVVVTKKSNINHFSTEVDAKEYRIFLENGTYHENLLKFSNISINNNSHASYSDKFKPLLTLNPDFILVDGSEYGYLDHTLAMQAELSMRVAKGTRVSARYNIPLSISDNFQDGGIFDYRNRNKTSSELDQLLLSQYLQFDLPYRWISLLQLGQFEKGLTGASVESSITTMNGKHRIIGKMTHLKDTLYQDMDRYYDEYRDEQLLSYQYYLSSLNSDIKFTIGEFLYGDQGSMFSFQRYFSDTLLRFDISKTKHYLKGEHTVGKLTLSVPFGTAKRVKLKYLDIQGDYLTYVRRKTIVNKGELNYSQPHHLKEIDNHFTLENYYLNNNRFHPSYIKENHNRLRNVFLSKN